MGDSSDEEYLGVDWIPYSERSEWSEVTPLPQDDRRDVLRAVDADLQEEFDYLDEVIGQNAKNYQVWHHRRDIVEMMNCAQWDLELTQNALDNDGNANNYHAWQHRQWAIRTFNLYDDELEFVDRLIREDQRNNSAWNQRFFVLKHLGFTPEVIRRELEYAMSRIRVIKNDNDDSFDFEIMGDIFKRASSETQGHDSGSEMLIKKHSSDHSIWNLSMPINRSDVDSSSRLLSPILPKASPTKRSKRRKTSSSTDGPYQNGHSSNHHASDVALKDDPDYNFLVSLLPHVRTLSSMSNMKFRTKVSRILMDLNQQDS